MSSHENPRTMADAQSDPLVQEVEAILALNGVTNPPDSAVILANLAFSGMTPEELAAHFISRAIADGDPTGYQSFVKDHTFISAPSRFKRTTGHPVVDAEGNWQVRKDPEE